MKHIIELLKSVPKAAALVGPKQVILECNDKFLALVGPAKGLPADKRLATGPHQDRLAKLLSATVPGWRGAEITLQLANGPTLCWCETHSLVSSGRLVHFLEILEVEQFHALEAAYLHQLRRVVDDNLWILDDEGVLIWVRADNQALEKYKGRESQALIYPSDRQLWNQLLAKVKSVPGQAREVQLRSVVDGGARFVDMCYLPGSLMGGRYYVASRSTMPSGSRVILRLKEAWAVSGDEDLGQSLGTNKSSISRANKAESVPPAWLIKTGQMTGFSLDWLLTGQGDKRRM